MVYANRTISNRPAPDKHAGRLTADFRIYKSPESIERERDAVKKFFLDKKLIVRSLFCNSSKGKCFARNIPRILLESIEDLRSFELRPSPQITDHVKWPKRL